MDSVYEELWSALEFRDRDVCLLKIDAEGSDFAVLRGAREVLSSFPAMDIVFEISPRSMRLLGHDIAAALRFLPDRGWPLHLVEGQRLIRIHDEEIPRLAARDDAFAVVATKRNNVDPLFVHWSRRGNELGKNP